MASANPDIEPQNVLLIYSAPNQVLEQKRLEESTATKCDEIHVHYEELSLLSLKYKNISSSWRLDLLDITSIRRLCNGEDPQLDKSNNFPSLKPLSSLLTLAIAKKEPRIIDIYLNLELKSCGLAYLRGRASLYVQKNRNQGPYRGFKAPKILFLSSHPSLRHVAGFSLD